MILRTFCIVAASAVLVGCGPAPVRPEASPTPEATPAVTPEASPTAAPTPEPTPTPVPIDTSAQVSVLGYHRFENPPRDPLAISTKMFREQMQALKDAGIPVIPMADFLAWRRGEKNIPPRSAVITIDDGYVSAYSEAWPVLKEFGYPFTMYVYTNYISAGGKSITWDQLIEMRDAGVDIGSHSISHDSMTRPKRAGDTPYDEWLWAELKGSKDMLEQKLGIPITTFAYPFGIHNDAVMQKGLEAGYEALFTVSGQKALHTSPAAAVGRYIVQSDKPFTFTNSLKFGGAASGAVAQTSAGPAAATMITQPMQNEVISDPRPVIQVNLATLGKLDPNSVEMRVSGFGPVPAEYDESTQLLRFPMHQKLREREVMVVVSGRADGKRVQASWTFQFDPKAAPTPAPSATPSQDPAIPEMKPAA